MSKTIQNTWNHREWSTNFRRASKLHKGFRDLRIQVFRSTVKIVQTGFYWIDDKKIEINTHTHDFANSTFYVKPKEVYSIPAQNSTTKVSVINADCIETAQLLVEAGFRPVVLNMANRTTPGGGVLSGAGAQEENIFRRSNLFQSLYQFAPFIGRSFDIPEHPKHPEHSYPLNRKTGGVYSSNITLFRGSEANGYHLLKRPYSLSFVTVPAIYSPDLVQEKGVFRLEEAFITPTQEKIRTILRIAILHGHDSIILSAFGCGAFRNPPQHMAELFQEVFEEEEFQHKISVIVFSIIDDHNARKAHNPDGNVLPFMRVFEG